MAISWAVGVTTVAERIDDPLPLTLQSLARAGFDRVRVFGDLDSDLTTWYAEGPDVSLRWPQIGAFGNWWLGMVELYLRKPQATYYAMFQDDLISSKNLRGYLEHCEYPKHGYWNLYTFLSNESVIKGKPIGWTEGGPLTCSDPNNTGQTGRGALGLVFSREALQVLLSSPRFVRRPAEVGGTWGIDKAVVEAMNQAGWREYIHNPSLLQHTGQKSTLGKPENSPYVKEALSFYGEDFDLLTLPEGRP